MILTAHGTGTRVAHERSRLGLIDLGELTVGDRAESNSPKTGPGCF